MSQLIDMITNKQTYYSKTTDSIIPYNSILSFIPSWIFHLVSHISWIS